MNVLVAMSGGVDSSVAAAMLVEAGHEVVGVTMKLWGGDSDTGCCSVSDVDDARRVAQQIGIDHLVFNFGEDFMARVVAPYVHAHEIGLTPNPCIECNRHLKFDRLLRRADQLGFDAVATGHHARIERRPDGRYGLFRGADRAKDQSYVVHPIESDRLERVMFPVGAVTKDVVRERARALGLRTASKPDSQDVCFITSSTGRSGFLGSRIPFRPARVVDLEGSEVGHVDAVELVTIGQRKGLGLPGGGDPQYVVGVDPAAGVVTVAPLDALMVTEQKVTDWRWLHEPVEGDVLVQCSAHGEPRPALVAGGTVRWTGNQRMVAAGQALVAYSPDDLEVVGAGIAV